MFGVFVAVTLGAVAATAVITYNVAHNAASAPSTPRAADVAASPQYSADDVAAAKTRICHIFDVSVRGQQSQGGMRLADGGLNVALAVRSINSAVAVENAVTPATPPNVAAAAKKYVSTTLDLTTAAMGNSSADEGNRLTDLGNKAIDEMQDVCGLAH